VAQSVEVGRDFSVIGMIAHADPVVQAIVALLIVCSIASWAITFEKIVRLRGLARQARALEAQAASGRLPADQLGIVGAMSQAALAELNDGGSPGEDRTGVRARLERAMRGAMKGDLRRLESGLPFLATVGSTTPFVGLFGTVWGIMHSFTAIAQSKDTSLAVVAPGIAEALFVTALGLAAAIPAVVAYNLITVSLGKAAERLNKSIIVLAKALSRDGHEKIVPIKGVK